VNDSPFPSRIFPLRQSLAVPVTRLYRYDCDITSLMVFMWREMIFGFFCVLAMSNSGDGHEYLQINSNNLSNKPSGALSISPFLVNSSSGSGHERRSLLSHPIIPIQKIFWMHIQKTSAWIGDLLLRFLPPEPSFLLTDSAQMGMHKYR
jgi:hypothetical protein